MVESDERIVCHLDCGHTAIYTPVPRHGDTVYCRIGMHYSKVIDNGYSDSDRNYGLPPIHVRCTQCKYARRESTQQRAELRANTHAIKRGHVLMLWRNGVEYLATVEP